jgi:phosphatidylinositol alpha-1,6-mannosyltransferase
MSLKIAIVAPEFPPEAGGMQEYAAQVAAGLHRRGHRIVVFSRKGNIGLDDDYEVRDILQGKQSRDRQAVDKFRNFDIVHVMNAAWCWVSNFDRPTFASIHGNDFLSPNPVYGYDLKARFALPKGDRVDFWLACWRTRRMMEKSLPQCGAIFSNSNFTKDLFLQRYPRCRGNVIKAGVGVSHFFLESTTSSRARGFTASLLTVCRLSEPRKNVDLVVRALARIKSEFMFTYTIVGDGGLKGGLVHLCAELGIADRVKFAGEVSRASLRSYYQDADLFVMASGQSETSFEGFGIVYLEANASGTPTMAVRAAGAREAIAEGRSGFFIEEPTVAAIEGGLKSFLSGSRTFSAENCRRFAEEFTWDRVLDRLEEAYVDELEGRSKPSREQTDNVSEERGVKTIAAN